MSLSKVLGDISYAITSKNGDGVVEQLLFTALDSTEATRISQAVAQVRVLRVICHIRTH
jgi:hypothetical protein